MNPAFPFFPPPPPAVLNARHYGGLTLATVLLTVYGGIIPLNYRDVALDSALTRLTRPDVIDPGTAQARGDWVVSVCLYATLSFLAMGALAVDRGARRGWEVAFLCFASCGLLAVFVEFLQCYFPPRTVSVNDLVVESAGAAVGVLAWLAAGRRLTEWFRRLYAVRGLTNLARLALPGYVAALLVVLLMPFDFVIRSAELAAKFDDGRVVLVPFARLAEGAVPFAVKTLSNAFCFGVLSFLTSLALAEANKWRTWRTAFVLGLGASAGIEVLQFFVYSRSCDVTDIITGTAGALLGWGAGPFAERLGRRASARPGAALRVGLCAAALSAWLGALLLIEWHPLGAFTADPKAFQSEEEELPAFGLRRMSWAPLVDYYWNDKYNALDQFAKKSLAFAPLGLLAALLPLRRHGARVGLAAAGAALLIGAVVEAGQYYHPAHHPSVTDLLLGVLGAASGYVVTRHVLAALAPGVAAMGKAA